MEKFNIIQLSIISLVILVETFFNIRNDFKESKIKETLANISIATFNGIAGIFFRGFTFQALIEIQKLSSFNFGHSVIVWILVFLLTDLLHYGFHFIEHKSRFFWATHSIHHSSINFDFSTAIRTAHTNTFYKFLYEAPLCLIGFDATMVFLMHNVILIIGFFQHTERVKKLGWLEWILNTPSHHRVHHSSDEKYLDKNFGGALIIWDRMFGTFQAEEEKTTYGLSKPINTHNPLKIVFHEWIAMAKDASRAGSVKQALSIMFNKPGWQPEPVSVKIEQMPKLKKTACKKCSDCSQKCLARLNQIKKKMDAMASFEEQAEQIPIPLPIVLLPYRK